MFYIGIYFSLLCHFEQLGIQSESGPKWTVQKGESGRSLKWTVAREWTVCPKVDGLELNWTVFWAKVDGRGLKYTVIRLKVDSPLGLI